MPTGRTQHRISMSTLSRASRRVASVGDGAVATIALLTGTCLAVPTAPERTLAEVKVEVEALYHEMEIAAEEYNAAAVRGSEIRARLATLRSNLTGLRRELTGATSAVGSYAAAQYRA